MGDTSAPAHRGVELAVKGTLAAGAAYVLGHLAVRAWWGGVALLEYLL